MNWETLYCPHRDCRCYGKPFTAGLLVKNGRSGGEPQARCTACGGSVALSYGTAYYGLKTDRPTCEIAVRALAEGNALRATGRIVQVDKLGAFGDSYAPYGYKHRRCRHGKVGGDGRALGIVENLLCARLWNGEEDSHLYHTWTPLQIAIN